MALNQKTKHCLLVTTDYATKAQEKGFAFRFCPLLKKRNPQA